MSKRLWKQGSMLVTIDRNMPITSNYFTVSLPAAIKAVYNGEIEVWNLVTGQYMMTFAGNAKRILTTKLSPVVAMMVRAQSVRSQIEFAAYKLSDINMKF